MSTRQTTKPEILRTPNSIAGMVQNTDVFSCGICGQNEDNLIAFLKHKLQHRGPGKCFVCQLCLISYTKQSTLEQHYKVKHKVKLFPRKVNVKKCDTGDIIQEVNDNVEKVDNSCNLEPAENIDVDVLFNNNSLEQGNVDHDYDRNNTEETVEKVQNAQIIQGSASDLENVISPGDVINPTVSDSLQTGTNLVEMGFLEMKSNNELTLCYGDTVVTNGNEGLIQTNGLVDSTPLNENSLITCNVEIISLDEPGTDLYIDDQLQEPESCDEDEDDEKTDELDFYFYIKNDINCGKNIVYERQDLCCIYCNFKDMVLANLFQHMCDHHQGQMKVNEETNLQATDETIKLIKFSEYKKLCCQRKLQSSPARKTRNTETQDQAGEYTCMKCNKVFTRLRYLKKHIALHKPDKPYLCDFCGKSFKTKTYLMIHHRSHDKRSFKCEQCDFTSSNTSLIRQHRQEHNDGCVLCDICGNAYSDKSTLTKHMRVHDPTRPYQCDYPGCTWRFLTEVMCRAHRRNHDTEGKFKCSYCGYAFRHKHHVKRHEVRMHGTCVKNQPDKSVDTVSVNDSEDLSSVNVVVESTMEGTCIQDSIPGGQLVITTDPEGNALNYQLTDISNVALMGSDEGRAIIIPQIDYSNVVLQRMDNSESSLIKVTLKDNI